MKGSKYTSLKDGFTLVEIMVASILISVVALALLQTHHNSSEMGYTMQKKLQHTDWVLIPANEAKLEKRKVNTSFDTLTKSFNIDQRDIRNSLKHKTTLSVELVERINAADMMKAIEEEVENDASTDEQRVAPVYEGLRLEVYQQSISIEDESYQVYRLIKP